MVAAGEDGKILYAGLVLWVAWGLGIGVWARGEGVPLPLLLLSFSSISSSFIIFAQFLIPISHVYLSILFVFSYCRGRE
jgi:hypothetical protein